MPIILHSEFELGDMLVRYQAPASDPGALGLMILPKHRAADVVPPRELLTGPVFAHLPDHWRAVTAWQVDPLVHVQRRGEPLSGGFAAGRTLHHSPTSQSFRVSRQVRNRHDHTTTIETTLVGSNGLAAVHELRHVAGEDALRLRTTLQNLGAQDQTIDLLTSFSLGGITPFAPDDAPSRLWLHRFRSAWSAEARSEETALENLHFERSWIGHGVRAERFGQIGSMPTNGYFPCAAVEDRPARVTWAARLAHPGSWQLELYRRADQVSLSGGLADLEFGHWSKRLPPGASFTGPEAFLTVVDGTVDDACDRLNSTQRTALASQPKVEHSLPIIFNEWCTSWGRPNHHELIALADRLNGSGVRYLVIDDGWTERGPDGSAKNGDWLVDRKAFPLGLGATAEAIRARGLIPGIWFELETVQAAADAWTQTAHQLHRAGVPLQVGTRRFWDFRDPWVHDYLSKRLIRFLHENRLGYLKIDYNETIGLGCDGPDSLGESLRQHLDGVQQFIRRIRTELPDLVIENCASGGHRAEPSMMALTAMTSASDAHETPDIPVIAANLHRLVCPAQNQIWAVLRKDDTPQRLSYSLAATFLGRMCLSGDLTSLPATAWEFVRQAIDLYRELAPLIARGRFRRAGINHNAWQHLSGHQAVVCSTPDATRAFVVWHTFHAPLGPTRVSLPEETLWQVKREFSDQLARPTIQGQHLILPLACAWSGGIILLEPRR